MEYSYNNRTFYYEYACGTPNGAGYQRAGFFLTEQYPASNLVDSVSQEDIVKIILDHHYNTKDTSWYKFGWSNDWKSKDSIHTNLDDPATKAIGAKIYRKV